MKPKAGTREVGRKTGEIVADWPDNCDEELREGRIHGNLRPRLHNGADGLRKRQLRLLRMTTTWIRPRMKFLGSKHRQIARQRHMQKKTQMSKTLEQQIQFRPTTITRISNEPGPRRTTRILKIPSQQGPLRPPKIPTTSTRQNRRNVARPESREHHLDIALHDKEESRSFNDPWIQ